MTAPAANSEEQAPKPSAADAAPPPRCRRRWRLRLMAVGLGVFLPLIGVELGVRLLWTRLTSPADREVLEQEPLQLGVRLRNESLANPAQWIHEWGHSTLFEADPARGLRHLPSIKCVRKLEAVPPAGLEFTVTTDRHGCRGPDRPDPPEGALVVLAVGDSMTFGEGVEDHETWPARLEVALAAALAPRPVRVFNAGVMSYGPQEERAVVAELVPKLRPDLVVLQFTAANDVVDGARWLDGAVPLREDPEACAPLRDSLLLENPLARWSRAYRWAAWRFGRHAVKYRYMCSDPPLDRVAAQLLGMRELARELRGAPALPVAVLVAPTVAQVEGGAAEALLDTVRINEGVAARLRAADAPVIDPLPDLRAQWAASRRSLYIPVDRHWTAEGHQAVTDALLPALLPLIGE